MLVVLRAEQWEITLSMCHVP